MSEYLERRPEGVQATTNRFPQRWTEREGAPPEGDGKALREWITRNLTAEGGRTTCELAEEPGASSEIKRTAALAAPPASRSARRSASPPAGGVVSGVAVPFLDPAVIGGAFREQFDSAALDDQQRGGWKRGTHGTVVSLWNHRQDDLLGSVRGDTLALHKSQRALHYALELPSTAFGEHIGELVRRRDAAGASIAFLPDVEDWELSDGMPLVTVRKATLGEVSVCWAPAYKNATAEFERTDPMGLSEIRQVLAKESARGAREVRELRAQGAIRQLQNDWLAKRWAR